MNLEKSVVRKPCVESLESRRMLTEFVVNSFGDFADDGDPSTMSLREAVALANELPGPDSILFDPSIFIQERTIELSLGEIGVTDELSIDASDLEQRVTIDAQLRSRIFNVQGPFAGSYSFSNLSLVRGSFSNPENMEASGYNGGGAIRLSVPRGDVTLTGVDVSGSRAVDAHGGGIYQEGLARLSITRSLIADNRVEGSATSGGGIYSRSGELVLVDSVVRNNVVFGNASQAGGISASVLEAIRTTVIDNRVIGEYATAGGILTNTLRLVESTVDGNAALGDRTMSAGGISAVTATIINSTISNNEVSSIDAARGGGIRAREVTVVGSTISGNRAFGAGEGGAIQAEQVTLERSTLTANVPTAMAFGREGGSLTIDNSIVAGNTNNIIPWVGEILALSGVVRLNISHSIIGDSTGLPLEESHEPDELGNLIGNASGLGIIDPMLGPLADNGGPTPARALLPGSPAIDAGSVESDDATDQRGGPYRRIVGAASDIGAFEVQTPRCVEPSSVSDVDVCAASVEERDMVLAEIGSPLGDLGDDGAVTVADFLVLSRNFGKDEDAFFSEGDLNLDGVIDVRDFLVLSSNFGSIL